MATVDEAGLEADDLLAAASRGATQRGWRTDVLSGDRDLTALVDGQVRLLRPRATMSDLVVTTPGVVLASYGVEADQYHDFAALRGDPSDGLPGVSGVGPKTAATLLADHGSLDEVYANLCYLPTKVERALRDGRDVAFHNRTVMEPIMPDQPIDLALDTAATFDLDAIVVILEDLGADDLGLARAARRLARANELAAMPRPDLTGVPPPDAPMPDDRERDDRGGHVRDTDGHDHDQTATASVATPTTAATAATTTAATTTAPRRRRPPRQRRSGSSGRRGDLRAPRRRVRPLHSAGRRHRGGGRCGRARRRRP